MLFWTIFYFGQFGEIYIESGLNVLNLCLFSELLDKIEPILGHICNSRATTDGPLYCSLSRGLARERDLGGLTLGDVLHGTSKAL